MRLASGLLGAACVLVAPGAMAAPDCVSGCEQLEARGELAEGLTALHCRIRTCHEEGRQLYRQRRFEQAIESLDAVSEDLERSPAYYMDRGLVLYALARYDEALDAFDRVVRVHPNGIRGGAQRAHTLGRLGRLDEALEQFESLRKSPAAERTFKDLRTGSYLVGNIAVLHLRKGEIARGKADLERALEIDGKNTLATTYLHRVLPALEQGTLSPAGLDLLERAFESLALGHVEQAAEDLAEVVERWPRYAPAQLLLAEGLRNHQRYDRCHDRLREAEKQIPDDIDIRLQRIRCGLLRYGVASQKAKPLIQELERIVDEDPDNILAHKILNALDAK